VGRKPRQLEVHANKLAQLSFQPDARYLASTDDDALLLIWDPFEHLKAIAGVKLSSVASCMQWFKDNRLAVGQEDGRIVFFELPADVASSAVQQARELLNQ